MSRLTESPRDKRIFSTGCASECPALWMPIRVLYRTREKLIWTDEQQKLNDCYFHQKDWRKCKKQVRYPTQLAPGLSLKYSIDSVLRYTMLLYAMLCYALL